MKVFHRNEADITFFKEFLNDKNNLKIEFQESMSLEELRVALKHYKGPPIGGDFGLIDFGKAIYTFVLSEEFASMVGKSVLVKAFIEGVIVPTYRHVFLNKKKDDVNNIPISIVTDNDSDNGGYDIVFSLELGLDEKELKNALSILPKVRENLLKLLEIAEFAGSRLIEVVYLRNHWFVQRFETSINLYTSTETARKIEQVSPTQKPGYMVRIRNYF